jgi:hypothetical protein
VGYHQFLLLLNVLTAIVGSVSPGNCCKFIKTHQGFVVYAVWINRLCLAYGKSLASVTFEFGFFRFSSLVAIEIPASVEINPVRAPFIFLLRFTE